VQNDIKIFDVAFLLVFEHPIKLLRGRIGFYELVALKQVLIVYDCNFRVF
jgi:hypothetical protein